MGFIPLSPHFAFVNFKLGDLNLTPIPPQNLEQFNYERVTKTGQANKLLMTVHDPTATALESALANGDRTGEFSYGYVNGGQSDTYSIKITEYDTDFTAVGVSLSLEGVSEGVAQALTDPESIAYKRMLISDIVKHEADLNNWYYDDTTIEPTAPVEESKEYSITTTVSSGATSTTGDSGSSSGPTGELNDGSLSSSQQKIISTCSQVGSPGGGLCAKWVSQVFNRAGYQYYGGNANDMADAYATSHDKSQLKPGMVVACHPSGATGSVYGHIGIYIGNGQVMHNTGQIQTSSLDNWINTYGPNGKCHGGEVGWGWMGGIDLSTS